MIVRVIPWFLRPSPVSMMAAPVRRLDDKDVRAIFESLHEGKPPPPNLQFQIVPVESHGLKLSPPSHEFPGMKHSTPCLSSLVRQFMFSCLSSSVVSQNACYCRRNRWIIRAT